MKAALYAILAAIAFYGGVMLGIHSKPQPQPPSGIVRAAAEKAETAHEAAIEAEKRAIISRPAVVKAQAELEIATETRIAAGFSVEGLPQPVRIEYEAMRSLIGELEALVERERQSAEAWKEAALAYEEYAEKLKEQHARSLKAEKRKSLGKGAAGGAAGILLLVLLI